METCVCLQLGSWQIITGIRDKFVPFSSCSLKHKGHKKKEKGEEMKRVFGFTSVLSQSSQKLTFWDEKVLTLNLTWRSYNLDFSASLRPNFSLFRCETIWEGLIKNVKVINNVKGVKKKSLLSLHFLPKGKTRLVDVAGSCENLLKKTRTIKSPIMGTKLKAGICVPGKTFAWLWVTFLHFISVKGHADNVQLFYVFQVCLSFKTDACYQTLWCKFLPTVMRYFSSLSKHCKHLTSLKHFAAGKN